VSIRLTKQQIEASPDARQDEPVTKQMETAAQLLEPMIFSEAAARQAADMESHRSEGDPHLRSVVSVNGYHVHARTATSQSGASMSAGRGASRPLLHHASRISTALRFLAKMRSRVRRSGETRRACESLSASPYSIET